MPALDAGARADPLIRGIHHFFQILVGEHLVRQAAAGTGDPGINIGHAAPVPVFANCTSSSLPMRCGTWFSTSSIATRMALAKPTLSELPWRIPTTARKPRRLAPL